MCLDCGCSVRGKEEEHHHDEHLHSNPHLNDPKTISVIKSILDKNDHEATHNRAHFDSHNILSINLMSSPGSGKTTLLEALKEVADFDYSVIEGDLETNRDADRLNAKGIQAVQIQTGSACHLDAMMVHKALHDIDLNSTDVCFVENVGNLVCPASYDVGTHLDVVLVSIPEGEDKIAKYPVMFRKADLVIFTKVDLLPYFEYDIQKEKEALRALNPSVDILESSTKDIASIEAFAKWINFKESYAKTMCLSIPSRVIKIDEESKSCVVETMGVQREASLMMMADGDVKLGDFVLIHISFVMNIISEEEAELSLQTYQELLEMMDEEERRQAILEGDACDDRAK